MTMLKTIFIEMLRGNFSFLILVVGIAQFVVMVCNARNTHKVSKQTPKGQDSEEGKK